MEPTPLQGTLRLPEEANVSHTPLVCQYVTPHASYISPYFSHTPQFCHLFLFVFPTCHWRPCLCFLCILQDSLILPKRGEAPFFGWDVLPQVPVADTPAIDPPPPTVYSGGEREAVDFVRGYQPSCARHTHAPLNGFGASAAFHDQSPALKISPYLATGCISPRMALRLLLGDPRAPMGGDQGGEGGEAEPWESDDDTWEAAGELGEDDQGGGFDDDEEVKSLSLPIFSDNVSSPIRVTLAHCVPIYHSESFCHLPPTLPPSYPTLPPYPLPPPLPLPPTPYPLPPPNSGGPIQSARLEGDHYAIGESLSGGSLSHPPPFVSDATCHSAYT